MGRLKELMQEEIEDGATKAEFEEFLQSLKGLPEKQTEGKSKCQD